MAKRSTKKSAGTKSSAPSGRSKRGGFTGNPEQAKGKHLVIVESPTKARTINKYLGPGYHVMASVGHVRDLPSRNPKGVKAPVPGVDLEHDFEPTYDILPDKKKTVAELKKAAKLADDVWFATDLDREGEAIAWHLAQALGIELPDAKRVVFNAITKAEIARAFDNPRTIDGTRVDAQQARRILDRIVGYQVSPLLWKKVTGGLSAGRVQSVATRLVVEREREIDAFLPEEYWRITGLFTPESKEQKQLEQAWKKWLADVGENESRTIKEQNAWLSEHGCLRSELIEFDGENFKPDNRDAALAAATALGFALDERNEFEQPKAKGPEQNRCIFLGHVAEDGPDFRIKSIETKRTTSRPPGPFITSTLQQQASTRLSFPLQRTMRIAQQLYEGVDLKGARGQTGLITYMRTDSTHLSGEAINMVRQYIADLGDEYLPEKPNFFSSSNKAAQEAHEAIRPTDVTLTPDSIRSHLSDEQFKLYRLIWERFVACQMTPAKWDATTVLIETHGERATASAIFKSTGRVLVFDGFMRISGVPRGDDVILPQGLAERQPVAPIQVDPTQHFTSPPPRYTEASLQKKLEDEGIGRPSTYAAIIGTIQDRKYVEQMSQRDRRLRATDLGMVVTDMLVEAFPIIMDVAYTRQMESELDQIEDAHHDWREMLRRFYGPFSAKLESAFENLTHAKAVTEPAPHKCPKCGAGTVYRFGKNGRFLSCSMYPECKFAAPIDREGNPLQPELTDVLCPEDNQPMLRRTGRFGPFLASQNYPEVKFIVKLDPKTGGVVLPKADPLTTDLPCPKCGSPLYLRESKRGFWLSCSTFPKCRGRMAWSAVEEDKQKELEKAFHQHLNDHPVPVLHKTDGSKVEEGYLPQVASAEGEGDGSVEM